MSKSQLSRTSLEYSTRYKQVAQLYQIEFATLDDAFGVITVTAARVTHAARVSVWLFADDETSLYCVHEYDGQGEGRIRKSRDESLLYLVQDEVYMQRLRDDPMVVVNVTEHSDSASISGGDRAERRPCTMLDVPIRVGGRIVGVLCHEDAPGRSWQGEDCELAAQLGYIVALAVGHDRQRRAATVGNRFRALLQQTPDSVALGDSHGMLQYLNPPARRLIGLAPDEPIEDYRLLDFLAPQSQAFMLERGLLLATSRGGWTGDLVLRSRRGREVEANMTITVFHGDRGTVEFISCVMRDICAHPTLERRLAATQARYEAVLAESSDALFRVDVQTGRLTYVTAALCDLLGYTRAELQATTVFRLVGDSAKHIRHNMSVVASEGHVMLGERQYRHKDGHFVDMEVSAQLHTDSAGTALSVHVRDISARQRRRRDIERLAFGDPCTGLANSNLLRERAEALLAESLPEATPVAYVITQIDRWQRFADTLGYDVAESLLRKIAERLRQVVGDKDIFVARLPTGAAFGLLFKREAYDARLLADEIQLAFGTAFRVERDTIHLAVRSGAAYFPEHAVSYKELTKRAGLALRTAHRKGWDCCIYEPARSGRLYDERLPEEDLRRAIGTAQIRLCYQPIVAAGSGGKITGLEALVRWDHPREGELPPDEFIPLAEGSDLIVDLDRDILLKATREVSAWLSSMPDVVLSVNCSARTLMHSQLVDTLRAALAGSGLLPAQLCLEITETAFIHDLQVASAVVSQISALGVKVALDDFGTGYSSLAYLTDLQVDRLKIDRGFTRGIGLDVRDERTIEMIVALSRDLGMQVVAEGVETWAQQEWLKSRKIDFLQGYYLGRPQNFADLRDSFGSRAVQA